LLGKQIDKVVASTVAAIVVVIVVVVSVLRVKVKRRQVCLLVLEFPVA